jgi:hypothetical protein
MRRTSEILGWLIGVGLFFFGIGWVIWATVEKVTERAKDKPWQPFTF